MRTGEGRAFAKNGCKHSRIRKCMMSNLRSCATGFGGTLFAARLLDVWPSRQCVDVREEEWHLASRMALSPKGSRVLL